MIGGERRRSSSSFRWPEISSSFLVLFLLTCPLLLSSFSIPASADGLLQDEEKKQTPNLAERAIGFAAFPDRWDAIKTWAKLTWVDRIKTTPPPSHSSSSPGQKVKEAAARSFEASKETVESAAASAAHVAEEVAQKTKKKLERTVSIHHGHHNQEL